MTFKSSLSQSPTGHFYHYFLQLISHKSASFVSHESEFKKPKLPTDKHYSVEMDIFRVSYPASHHIQKDQRELLYLGLFFMDLPAVKSWKPSHTWGVLDSTEANDSLLALVVPIFSCSILRLIKSSGGNCGASFCK